MQYVSIDCETTGLKPSDSQLLEFAAVYENGNLEIPVEDLPTLHVVFQWPLVVGNAQAIAMNIELLVSGPSPGARVFEVKTDRSDAGQFDLPLPMTLTGRVQNVFADWLLRLGIKDRVTFAGKNVRGFDLEFMPWLKPFAHHRIIDPAMFYAHWEDEKPPSLAMCKERAGIEGVVSHTAVEDARDVIRLVRKALT